MAIVLFIFVIEAAPFHLEESSSWKEEKMSTYSDVLEDFLK
jgi:hypothetical protein